VFHSLVGDVMKISRTASEARVGGSGEFQEATSAWKVEERGGPLLLQWARDYSDHGGH